MGNNKKNTNQQILALGIAITLPMILVSGPLAGYLIARFILVKYVGLPTMVVPIFIFFGFLASGIQTYRLIQRIRDMDL